MLIDLSCYTQISELQQQLKLATTKQVAAEKEAAKLAAAPIQVTPESTGAAKEAGKKRGLPEVQVQATAINTAPGPGMDANSFFDILSKHQKLEHKRQSLRHKDDELNHKHLLAVLAANDANKKPRSGWGCLIC
jgi:hypothetical protein